MEGPSTNLVINNVTYPYPLPDATQWGQEASNWAIAVTNGMLQKSGGLFSLQSDVNFGANFGVFAPYFGDSVGSHATTGVLRLSHGDLIAWRNQTSTANVTFGINGSTLQINGSPAVSVNASGGTTGMSFTGGPVTSTGTLTLTGTLAVANGGTGATTLSGLVYGNGTGPLTTVTPDVLGKVLMSTGVSTPPEWTTVTGVGTVVEVDTGTGLTGGPFTSSGTISLNSSSIASLALANSALQTGDDVSELVNDAGYLTANVLANPTATIGLTAVNGVSTSAMRADAAPVLSQSISPTWTGTHTFSGNDVTIQRTSANAALNIQTTTSGSPMLHLDTLGQQNWTIGVDRSNGFLVFSSASNLSSSKLTLTPAGAISLNATCQFKNNTWHTDTAAFSRLYFSTGAAGSNSTYLRSAETNTAYPSFIFRNGSDTDLGGFRSDGLFYSRTGLRTSSAVGGTASASLIDNAVTGALTYGGWYMEGARNSYAGLAIYDGSLYPTLMSNGNAAGIYNQGEGRWLLYRNSSTTATSDYGIQAPSFNVSSSRDLKDELGGISAEEATAILDKLRPIKYKLKDGDRTPHIGLIAEEVYETCPELSHDGKSVRYDRIAMLLLVRAVS